MSNVLFNVFSALDAQVMKGVNAGVHAYNWTTGGTKYELAKNVSMTAPICECTGFFSVTPPLVASFCSALFLGLSYLDQKRFERINEAEVAALERNMLDYSVECEEKGECCFKGYIWSGTGGFERLACGETTTVLSIGFFLRGTSSLIMRADYLPPRKNCVRRGLEHLTEKYATATAKHMPAALSPLVALQFSLRGGREQ